MSTNTTSKRLRWLALAAVIGSVGFGLATPASAFDRRDDRGGNRHWEHNHNHNHWRHGYYRPQVRYYQPAPRYYAPPAYYYAPPAVSFGFNFR